MRALRRFAFTALAAACLLVPAARPAHAQDAGSVRLTIRLTPDSARSGARAPVVRSENLLADGRWLSALRSGLPVRLHYVVGVWRSRGGWFDAFERQAEWDVVIRHEPLLDQFTVLTLVGERVLERRYATLDALSAALSFAYQVSVRPAAPGIVAIGTCAPSNSRCSYTSSLTMTASWWIARSTISWSAARSVEERWAAAAVWP